MTNDRITRAVAAAAIGFGITGLFTPRLLARLLGFRSETGESRYLMRIAAVEDFGLGINLLLAGHEERRRLLAVAGAIDVVCCVLAIAAGASGVIPRRAATRLVAVTGAVSTTAAMSLLPVERRG